MRTDDEIKKATRITVKDGIIDAKFLLAYKDDDDAIRHAELFRDVAIEAAENASEETLDAIVDLTPIENIKIPIPVRGGQIYKQVAAHPKIRRIAIVGTKPFFRLLIKFVVMAARKKDSIQIFNSRDLAMNWLKETK